MNKISRKTIDNTPYAIRRIFGEFLWRRHWVKSLLCFGLIVFGIAESGLAVADAESAFTVRFSFRSDEWARRKGKARLDLAGADPKAIADAVQSMREASKLLTSRQNLALEVLFDAKRYDDVEQLAVEVAITRAGGERVYADVEKLRAAAFLAQSRFPEALSAARSYYDSVRLNDTADAVEFVAEALTAASPKDPDVGIRFKREQFDRASAEITTRPDDWPKSSILASIPPDEKAYSDAADALDPDLDGPVASNAYKIYVMKGNLLLLAGRSHEAEDIFERSANAKQNKPAEVVENVARAIRAEEGCVGPANAYLEKAQKDRPASPAVEPVNLNNLFVPPLELKRQQEENKTKNSASDAMTAPAVTIDTGFESSPPMEVKQITSTHYSIVVPSEQWFMFRAHGVAGKLIRFDLVNPNVNLNYWATLSPVYTYASDLNADSAYATESDVQPSADHPEEKSWNGGLLPPTLDQAWHFIPNAWQTNLHQFSFVHRFVDNDVTVAMRVPLLPTYCKRHLRELARRPLAEISELPSSEPDLPVQVLTIGADNDSNGHPKPCIVLYAGEHADEQDAMQVAIGAADFLLGNDTEAESLRRSATFILIPMVDPAASAKSMHQHSICSFMTDRKTAESVSLSNWFRRRVDENKRLDLCLDSRNVQSLESTNVSCAILEGESSRAKYAASINDVILHACFDAGLNTNEKPWEFGWCPDRLGGWLTRWYGTMTIVYEFNSQAEYHHLNLRQQRSVGRAIMESAVKFFTQADGNSLLADIDFRRRSRANRLAGAPALPAQTDAITSELSVFRSRSEQDQSGSDILSEKWVR